MFEVDTVNKEQIGLCQRLHLLRGHFVLVRRRVGGEQTGEV